MTLAVERLAQVVADRANDPESELAPEVMRLNDSAAAIVVEIEGVDYILTLQTVPHQRPRRVVH